MTGGSVFVAGAYVELLMLELGKFAVSLNVLVAHCEYSVIIVLTVRKGVTHSAYIQYAMERPNLD